MIGKICSLLFLIVTVRGGSGPCKDKVDICNIVQLAGYCDYPPVFDEVKNNCERTCKLCGITTPEPPPATVKPGGPLVGCGRSAVPQGRVIGGVDAPQGAWPWQAGLYFGDNDLNFFCGGSLVNPLWVVTAAHCIEPGTDLNKIKVRLGDTHRFYNDGSEQIFGVSKAIVHKDYNRTSILDNDIALLRLDRPVMLTSYVSPVCLPDSGIDVPLDSVCFITGWGKIKHPGPSHHKLQQAKLKVVDNAECTRALHASPAGEYKDILKITNNMVCAGQIVGDVMGGCHGDSGGPFVCKDKSSGSFYLQGAVSWGSANCNFEQKKNQYTVFARVSELRKWIDDNMH